MISSHATGSIVSQPIPPVPEPLPPSNGHGGPQPEPSPPEVEDPPAEPDTPPVKEPGSRRPMFTTRRAADSNTVH